MTEAFVCDAIRTPIGRYAGALSSVRRVALTLGLPTEFKRKVDIVQKYFERMQSLQLIPPRVVDKGPVQENIISNCCQVCIYYFRS